MDFIMPDVPLRKIERNPFHDKLKQEIEQWVTNYVNKNWTDNQDLIKTVSLAYRNVSDYDRLLLVSKFTIAGFMLDDKLDFVPQTLERYTQFFLNNTTISDGTVEFNILKEVYSAFRERTSARFVELLLRESVNFVKACGIGINIRKSDTPLTVSTEQIYDIRKYDSGCVLYVVFTVYVYDVSVDILSIGVVSEFLEHCIRHLVLVNDLYSFRKEFLANTIKFNYVYALSIERGVCLQEAANLVVTEILEHESRMHSLKDRIVNNYPEVPVKYLVGFIELCEGCLAWSKICNRYNKFE